MGGRGSKSGGMGRGGASGVTWDARGTQDFLQGELDKYGLGMSKRDLANRLYNAANANGGQVSILNEQYLTVTGSNGSVDFSFTKSRAEGKWKLTPNLKYNDVTKGRHNGVTMYHAAGQWFPRKADAEAAVVRKKLG